MVAYEFTTHNTFPTGDILSIKQNQEITQRLSKIRIIVRNGSELLREACRQSGEQRFRTVLCGDIERKLMVCPGRRDTEAIKYVVYL